MLCRMAVNARPGRAIPGPPALLAAVGRASDADRAIAEGADLIDVTGLTAAAAAAAGERVTRARLWTGSPAAVDADGVAGDADSLAAVVAAAAIGTWLGAPLVTAMLELVNCTQLNGTKLVPFPA